MHMPVFLFSINGKQHGGFPVAVVTKSLVLGWTEPGRSGVCVGMGVCGIRNTLNPVWDGQSLVVQVCVWVTSKTS